MCCCLGFLLAQGCLFRRAQLGSPMGVLHRLSQGSLHVQAFSCRASMSWLVTIQPCSHRLLLSNSWAFAVHPASSVLYNGSPGTCLCKCLLELATGPPPSGTQRGLAEPHLGSSRCRLEHTWELSRCLLEGKVSASLLEISECWRCLT